MAKYNSAIRKDKRKSTAYAKFWVDGLPTAVGRKGIPCKGIGDIDRRQDTKVDNKHDKSSICSVQIIEKLKNMN